MLRSLVGSEMCIRDRDTGALQLAAAKAHGASIATGAAGASMDSVFDSAQATLKAAGAANEMQLGMIRLVTANFNQTGAIIEQQRKLNAKAPSKQWTQLSLAYRNAATEIGIATKQVAAQEEKWRQEMIQKSLESAHSVCAQDEYSGCLEVQDAKCPDGLYKIRPNRTLYTSYCRAGHEYRAAGCDPGWVSIPNSGSGSCYRLFVPNGPVGGRGVRSQFNIDEDYATFAVAKKHCEAHGARCGG
eukprot:TRINITY_DN24540_c0_g1_i1.p1 TRINITY_DN24540_c0_g1~~TRINITY_DN24540_c0_g1_i1.p1  ORF type:complete len:244 (+),score=58.03 TRINITY_DN24540_c0_g1_i1:137-868(+)